MPAGVRGKNGRFPKGTLYHLVDARLDKIGAVMQAQGVEKAGRKKRRHASQKTLSQG